MVKFSDLRAASRRDLRPARDLLTPAVVTLALEGEVNEAEINTLNSLIAFNPTFSGLTDAMIDEITNAIMDDVLLEGRARMIGDCAKNLPASLHETAFAFAVLAAMADGYMSEKEQDVLAEIAEAFGLPVKAVEHISYTVQVMRHQAESERV